MFGSVTFTYHFLQVRFVHCTDNNAVIVPEGTERLPILLYHRHKVYFGLSQITLHKIGCSSREQRTLMGIKSTKVVWFLSVFGLEKSLDSSQI